MNAEYHREQQVNIETVETNEYSVAYHCSLYTGSENESERIIRRFAVNVVESLRCTP